MNRSANLPCCCYLLLALSALVTIHTSANAMTRFDDQPPAGPPAGPPACPDIESLCGDPPPKPGTLVEPLCHCGPGEWIRTDRTSFFNPAAPIHSSWVGSENFVGWRTSCDLVARDGTAAASIALSGTSSFWHAGSRTTNQLAQYSGGWAELWHGTYPACARSVLLAAVGSGGLGIGGSCAARMGCSAASSATAAGMATSRGNASTSLTNLEIRGTVAFDSVAQVSKIDGNFGANVAFRSGGVDGTLSSNASWTVHGQGSATGSMSFTVCPDRTYCALTNLPIAANWTGTVVVSTAVTVDENGTAAGSAGAALTLSIN